MKKQELLPHNAKYYHKIISAFDGKRHRVLFIHFTGGGKTYISTNVLWHRKYVLKKADKIGIVVGSLDQMGEWLEVLCLEDDDNVKFYTYESLYRNCHNKEDLNNMLEGRTIIIMDECQRSGSILCRNLYKWVSKDVDIFGITANPLRPSDKDCYNIQEYFNSTIKGISYDKAIEMGLIVKPRYIGAEYDEAEIGYFDEHSTIHKKCEIDKSVLVNPNRGSFVSIKSEAEIQKSLDIIKEMILLNLPTDGPTKGIVFVPAYKNGETIEPFEKILKEIFPSFHIYKCHSKYNSLYGTDYNAEQISYFKNDKDNCLIISIDMLNTGYHIKGTNTLIFFRPTTSCQIYEQQRGRLASAGSKADCVIFDIVNNYLVLYDTAVDCRERRPPQYSTRDFVEKESRKAGNFKFTVKGGLELDIIELIKSIKEEDEWYKDEDTKAFNINIFGYTDAYLQKEFPGRTPAAVRRRSKYLFKISKFIGENPLWVTKTIREYIYNVPNNVLRTMIPFWADNWDELIVLARKVAPNKVYKCRWNTEYNMILIKYYKTASMEWLQEMIHHATSEEIKAQAKFLNLV